MKIVKKNTTYFLNLESGDNLVIDKYLNKNIELISVTPDVLVLKVKEKELPLEKDLGYKKEEPEKTNLVPKKISLDSEQRKVDPKLKIINFLNNKNLDFKEKLEGSFEKFLTKEDLVVFTEMVKNKEIVVSKLSEKYKTGFYTISKDSPHYVKPTFKKKNVDDEEIIKSFAKNNFVILKNRGDLNIFKQKYEKDVGEGKIKGIKSFDGNTYVVALDLLTEIKEKIIEFEGKSFELEDLIKKTNKDVDLLKAVIEILKEEAFIAEKKKNLYVFV